MPCSPMRVAVLTLFCLLFCVSLSFADEQVAASEAQLQALQQKIDEAKSELQRINGEIENKQQSARVLNSEISDLEGRIRNSRSESDASSSRLREQKNEIHKLDEEIRQKRIEAKDTEKGVLEILFRSLNGPNWIRKRNWLNGDPCRNNWWGIYCTGGRVQKIWLFSNNLDGEMPDGKLFAVFEKLEELNLSDNKIRGEIPSALGDLRGMKEIYLSWNSFTGTIPQNFGQLASLEWLSLRGNQLEGSVPASMGACEKMSGLDLADNPKMIGEISRDLGKMWRLHAVDLHNTGLYGPMPESPSSWRRFYPNVQKFKYRLGIDEIYVIGGDAHVLKTVRPNEVTTDVQQWRFFVINMNNFRQYQGVPLLVSVCQKRSFGDILVQKDTPPFTASYAYRFTKSPSKECVSFNLEGLQDGKVSKWYISAEHLNIFPKKTLTVTVTPTTAFSSVPRISPERDTSMKPLSLPVGNSQGILASLKGMDVQTFKVNVTTISPFSSLSLSTSLALDATKKVPKDALNSVGIWAKKGCQDRSRGIYCSAQWLWDMQSADSLVAISSSDSQVSMGINPSSGRAEITYTIPASLLERGCYCIGVGFSPLSLSSGSGEMEIEKGREMAQWVERGIEVEVNAAYNTRLSDVLLFVISSLIISKGVQACGFWMDNVVSNSPLRYLPATIHTLIPFIATYSVASFVAVQYVFAMLYTPPSMLLAFEWDYTGVYVVVILIHVLFGVFSLHRISGLSLPKEKKD